MALPKTFTANERLFAEDLNSNFGDLDSRATTLDARTGTLENEAVKSPDVDNVVVLTQSAYDGLTPSARTLYVIVG